MTSGGLVTILVTVLIFCAGLVAVPPLARLAYRKGVGVKPAFVKKLEEKQAVEDEAQFHGERVRSWLRKQGLSGLQLSGDRGRANEFYLVKDDGVGLVIFYMRNRKWEPMTEPRGRTRLCYDLLHNESMFSEIKPLAQEEVELAATAGQLSLVLGSDE